MSVFLHDLRIVLRKELIQESAQKYIINTVLMFALILVIIIAFISAGMDISNEWTALLYWLVVYFSLISGISQVFLKEVDRQTIYQLKLMVSPRSIFWGKALFLWLSTTVVSLTVLILFVYFFHFESGQLSGIIAAVIMSTLAMAVSGTMLSMLIAHSVNNGMIYGVISFPVVFPLIFLATQLTTDLLNNHSGELEQWIFLGAFDMITIFISALLFEPVWEVID